jgi:carboxynorspermidine decarboxylase
MVVKPHVFSAAYTDSDMKELLGFANHIVFNSCSQLVRFSDLCRQALEKRPEIKFGLRINPEHSEGSVPIYDPCAPGSRLGVTISVLKENLQNEAFKKPFSLVSGLHFHTLCEQDFLPLERTLLAVEQNFGKYLPSMEWINMGGGHHITAPGYQVEALIDRLKQFSEQYQVKVYLEPGEAIAIGTGVLVVEVLDIAVNEHKQVILDTSATCHMPDTLEMPYRPEIIGSAEPGSKQHTYRLGGLTCLAGDVIGDYSFDRELSVGQRLLFEDMAHYTMVKTTMFNGTKLPAIAIWNSITDTLKVVKEFSYDDFKSRLS